MFGYFRWARRHPRQVASWLPAVVLALVAVAVAATTAAAAFDRYSPLPFSDQWVTVAELQRIDEGGNPWSELWRQHNEHRLAVPRLVFYADAWLLSGRYWLPLAATWAAELAMLAAVASLTWRALRPLHRAAAWACAIVVAQAALLLSATQLENLVWAFQAHVVIALCAGTMACLVLAAAAGTPAAHGRRRTALLVLALLCAIAASLSHMAAFAVWPVLIAQAVWLRAPRDWVVIVAATGPLLAGVFFWSWDTPPGQTTPLDVLADPGGFAAYLLACLGTPWSTFGEHRAQALGAFTLAAWLLVTATLLASRRRPPPPIVALWAAATLAVLGAAVSSSQHLAFGTDEALGGRSGAGALLAWAALLPLLRQSWAAWSPRGRMRWLAPAAALIALAPLAGAWGARDDALNALRARQAAWPRAEDALISGVYDPEVVDPLFVPLAAGPNLRLVDFLAAKHDSVFAGDRGRWMGANIADQFGFEETGTCIGYFDAVEPIPGAGGARVTGWAWDERTGRTFRDVVLADAGGIVVGVAHGGVIARPDVPVSLPVVGTDLVGWVGYARASTTPVRAFGLFENGGLCPFTNEHRIEP